MWPWPELPLQNQPGQRNRETGSGNGKKEEEEKTSDIHLIYKNMHYDYTIKCTNNLFKKNGMKNLKGLYSVSF